ncbi:synaptotagmin-9 isoform X2 [Diorhabda sublineata]|uniref:synaptotagmin-9 isoform X2 n=1 Tax=Diorhabda sublineata TaxID=1163346 RepID=UPI0024E105F9|nr:synaptotagmin-9 isoform X2 [Diorhabda sublineata]
MVDYGQEQQANRFVCPNDRQLALRAKLNTGWSVKTASFGYSQKAPPISPLAAEEQEAIVQVIQRAEQLDISEQQRIGKLVEKLENMRRNALGKNSSQCLLCGDGFGLLGAQKINCMDCRRQACTKCSIDTLAGKGPRHVYQTQPKRSPFLVSLFYFTKKGKLKIKKVLVSSTTTKEHWLCMICAETREMWKKSGAWFYKSIPKYILPVDNSRLTRNKSVRASRRHKDDDSSSDDERKIWGRRKRMNSSTESAFDALDQDQPVYNNNITSFIYRQTSSSESQVSREMDSLKTQVSSITLNDTKSYEDSGTEGRGIDADISECSRRESVAIRSSSDWNWTDTRAEDRVSPSTSSVNSSILKMGNEDKSGDTMMGVIELSLTYDQEANTLHCAVYRAKNLIPMDMSGLSDPFCKLNILPNAKISTRLRTKTVHKTRNPEFNENLTFYDISESDLMKKSLHILVVDDDKYGHDYMGETRIKLVKLKYQSTIYLTVPLENLRTEQKGAALTTELTEWFDDLWSRGQILLGLCYNTKKRALVVTVVRCINLLPMDNNGLSDPFVKLQLKPDPNHKKHKTSIKWKNLNPVFNEEFAFETRPTELSTQSLYVTVYDKDYGKSNDYLGGLILGGTGSKGLRLKHWMDMIRYPDHRHEQWHNLTEDILD